MLNKVFKILPFFVVEWLAKHYCEVITIDGLVEWHAAFDGALIKGEHSIQRATDGFDSEPKCMCPADGIYPGCPVHGNRRR
jgi:hypothetical protein